MQENIKRYHPLGKKTLLVFILKKSFLFFALLLLLFLALYGLNYVPFDYIALAVSGIFFYSWLLLVIFVVTFFIGWLQYIRYWIFVDDKDLKIARGLISTEQIGVPYRQVQDIKIKRTLLDQIFGVSDIVVTVLASDEGGSEENEADESTLVLPSIAKEIALEIQDIVLKKAQVQQINVLGNQKTF